MIGRRMAMCRELLVKQLDFLHKNLLVYLNYWPEGKEDWKPVENSFSLLELACHLCNLPDDYVLILQGKIEALNKKMEASSWPEQGPSDIASTLNRSFQELKETIDSFSDEDFTQKMIPWPFGEPLTPKEHLMNLITHMYHHRGQFHLYLKQLGKSVDTDTVFSQ
jgi:uncharacterized damage-inducible protein DinB